MPQAPQHQHRPHRSRSRKYSVDWIERPPVFRRLSFAATAPSEPTTSVPRDSDSNSSCSAASTPGPEFRDSPMLAVDDVSDSSVDPELLRTVKRFIRNLKSDFGTRRALESFDKVLADPAKAEQLLRMRLVSSNRDLAAQLVHMLDVGHEPLGVLRVVEFLTQHEQFSAAFVELGGLPCLCRVLDDRDSLLDADGRPVEGGALLAATRGLATISNLTSFVPLRSLVREQVPLDLAFRLSTQFPADARLQMHAANIGGFFALCCGILPNNNSAAAATPNNSAAAPAPIKASAAAATVTAAVAPTASPAPAPAPTAAPATQAPQTASAQNPKEVAVATFVTFVLKHRAHERIADAMLAFPDDQKLQAIGLWALRAHAAHTKLAKRLAASPTVLSAVTAAARKHAADTEFAQQTCALLAALLQAATGDGQRFADAGVPAVLVAALASHADNRDIARGAAAGLHAAVKLKRLRERMAVSEQSVAAGVVAALMGQAAEDEEVATELLAALSGMAGVAGFVAAAGGVEALRAVDGRVRKQHGDHARVLGELKALKSTLKQSSACTLL